MTSLCALSPPPLQLCTAALLKPGSPSKCLPLPYLKYVHMSHWHGLCSSLQLFCPKIGLWSHWSAILGGLGGLSAIYRICSFHFPKSGIAGNRKGGIWGKAESQVFRPNRQLPEVPDFQCTGQNQTTVLFPEEPPTGRRPGVGAAPPALPEMLITRRC